MTQKLHIAFFGSSLVSAYWNGAATYYRGLLRALHRLGHQVTFYEPDAFDRQAHRDMPDPPYADVVVYAPDPKSTLEQVRRAATADVVVKASGVGVNDALLAQGVLEHRRQGAKVVFWDVDAPATLERLQGDRDDPLGRLVPEYDLVLTYGGGGRVVQEYERLGARRCVPVYNALDPETHHPVPPDARFHGDLAFLGNRLPDREERVERFFFGAARRLPRARFLLGGNGWDQDAPRLPNVTTLGHVYTRDHNALNSSARVVLSINRESMARFGFSPATRVFEAAGAAACLITDAWDGIEHFLEPGQECLVAQDGDEVADHLASLDPATTRRMGQAARQRVLGEHTYGHRAVQVEELLLSDAEPEAPAAREVLR